MQLNKFSLFITLFLLARTNQGKIAVGTPSLSASISRLYEDLIGIVASCYGDRNNGVGLVGNLPDTFIRSLSVQHSIPVTSMRNTSRLSQEDCEYNSGLPRVPIKFRHKLNVFIVKGTGKELGIIIRNVRYSIWWNHMASFFILDLTPGCSKYATYLVTAWNINILNAKVICRTKNAKTVIITYNPFTRQAPVAWRRFQILSANARVENVSHPFVTFFRMYRKHNEICVNLDFDKAKDLGGFPVFIEGYDEIKRVNNSHKFKEANKMFNAHKRVLSTIFHAMNATPEHLFVSKHRELLGDVRMHPLWMNGLTWTLDLITYPHEQVGFTLVSQFRGHKSQLNKILTVVDVDSRIGLGVVYLITLTFFKFFVDQTLVPAILNIVRITCNTGFTNLPDNNAPRVFLTALLFFVVTMQGIYQGNLASLLTTVIPIRDIETMQDVVDFGYKIYGEGPWLRVVDHPDLRKRYIGVDSTKCIAYVTDDPSAVCLLIGAGITIDRVRKNRLHTSNEFVTRVSIGFRIRWDSPFEHRMNIIIRRLLEANVLNPWELQCAPTELTEFQFDEEVKKNVVFKNIELGELTFAFVILGIGLICATITFIAEVSIYTHTSRIVNVRVPKKTKKNMVKWLSPD